MKKLKLILLIIYLICFNGFSQAEAQGFKKTRFDGLKSDTINRSPNKDFEELIRLKPIDQSSNKIEIRYYKHEGLSNTRDLIILELKGNSWQATLHSESNFPARSIKKFDLKSDKALDVLYKKLLEKNLITLPSQKDLEPKMKKYIMVNGKRAEEIIRITDGQSYTIEFKIEDKFRIYTYHNPKTYSDFYNNVQELKDFLAMVDVFEKELKIK